MPRSRSHQATCIHSLGMAAGGAVMFGDDAGILGRWNPCDDSLDEFEIQGFANDLVLVFERTPYDWVVGGPEGLAFVHPNGHVRLRAEEAGSVSAAVSAGERRILTAGYDEHLRLLDTDSGRTLAMLRAGERISGLAPLPGTSSFAVVACYQGGSRLFWVDVQDDDIRRSPRPVLNWPEDHVSASGIDVSGTYLGCAGHRFEIFEIATGRRCAWVDERGRSGIWGSLFHMDESPLVERFWSGAVAFGDGIACASPNGMLYCFDPRRGRRVVEVGGIEGGVTTLGGDGRGRLVAAGRDGRLHLFE